MLPSFGEGRFDLFGKKIYSEEFSGLLRPRLPKLLFKIKLGVRVPSNSEGKFLQPPTGPGCSPGRIPLPGFYHSAVHKSLERFSLEEVPE